ncbi:Fanconi anemia group E protein isoform X2 [Hyperolius riggenbachi]|uniref:Fanconi anemia group E protein isoform X2 n=1 Tax=Hyperolius riggenbachi TaxID=752182 RepID=UPI0035A2E28B
MHCEDFLLPSYAYSSHTSSFLSCLKSCIRTSSSLLWQRLAACGKDMIAHYMDCDGNLASTLLNDPGRAGFILLQALSNEQNGLLAAQKVLQRFPGPFPWISIMENLCTKEPTLDASSGEMSIKPKLVLLPLQTQRNLLRFLSCMFNHLPAQAIQLLGETIAVEHYFSDAWLLYLRQHLLTMGGMQDNFQSSQMGESLRVLCKHLSPPLDEPSRLGWYKNRSVSVQNKNSLNSEVEALIVDIDESNASNCMVEMDTNSQVQSSLHEENTEYTAATEEVLVLPASVEARVPRLKQFLYLNMESESLDHEFLTEMSKICELCSPLQLQSVFSSAGISQISTKCLFQLCVHLDALSPDLSYAHAKSLAGSFFLDRVFSLTSPASRTLTGALSVFCNKYSHPACSSLIGPVLDKAESGSVCADFLCRMISECLQPQHLHMCLSPILDSPCTEVAISVLHLIIDKKDKFCQTEFSPLLNYLCHAAEDFSKSVTFSRLLLVLLTSKSNLITLSHVGPLTSTVNCNQTFMKKSLQNALKKITENFK